MASNVSRELMEHADVVVIGAGPAGCWASRTLAMRGARATLVDGSHPREKPCGGGVTGRALALVSGAIDASRLPICGIHAARFVDGVRNTSTVVPLGERALVVADRTAFDGALLAAATTAGAALVRARAVSVSRDPAGFVIHTRTERIHARVLIG